MNILVTGGAGYIGSHTTHLLVQIGHKIVVLDNLSTGYAWTIPKSAIFVKGSTGDQELVSRILREHSIQAVIHFAASIQVEESVLNPLKYYENNTLNSSNLISACYSSDVKQFVFSSTAAVYGSPKELPVGEDCLPQPMSPYGTSKLMTEWILGDVSRSSLLNSSKEFRFVILRYFNVAGAQIRGNLGQLTKNATHLIKVASEAACGLRQIVPLYGTDYATQDGTCVRDFIHVDDLALAHLNALEYLEAGGKSQTFNCGYGHGFSVKEVLSTVKKVSGVDFSVKEEMRRPGDIPAIIADSRRIREVLQWKPKYDDLDLICKTAYDWEKKRLKLDSSVSLVL